MNNSRPGLHLIFIRLHKIFESFQQGHRADQTKWLVEAKISLAYEKNTVFIKQYFHPNFVINHS